MSVVESVIDRLEVAVTFDPAKGYVGTAPELRQPVVALSLGGLRRKIEAALLPAPKKPIVGTFGCCARAASGHAAAAPPNKVMNSRRFIQRPHRRG